MYTCKYLIQQYYKNYQETKNHTETMTQMQDLYAKKDVNESWGKYYGIYADFAVYYVPPSEYEKNNIDSKNGYRIDCGVFQGDKNNSMMLDSFWEQKFSFTNSDGTVEHYNGCEKAILGPGTPTIDALATVKDSLGTNKLPKDVILLTDGDYANSAILSDYKKYSVISQKNPRITRTHLISKEIMEKSFEEKEAGFYPIAYGAGLSIDQLRGDFTDRDNNGKEYFTKFYVAGDEKALAANFAEILADVIQKTQVQTNTSQSHSLQYVGEDGNIQEYKQDGVYQIVLELKGKDKSPITITFDKSGNNSGGVKPLDSIYQDGAIKLENTWQQLFGSNPDELNAYNDKKITLYVE